MVILHRILAVLATDVADEPGGPYIVVVLISGSTLGYLIKALVADVDLKQI